VSDNTTETLSSHLNRLYDIRIDTRHYLVSLNRYSDLSKLEYLKADDYIGLDVYEKELFHYVFTKNNNYDLSAIGNIIFDMANKRKDMKDLVLTLLPTVIKLTEDERVNIMLPIADKIYSDMIDSLEYIANTDNYTNLINSKTLFGILDTIVLVIELKANLNKVNLADVLLSDIKLNNIACAILSRYKKYQGFMFNIVLSPERDFLVSENEYISDYLAGIIPAYKPFLVKHLMKNEK
jgi:hypothetical protein